MVWYESHLERDFIYLTEFDKDVIQYREQPFKVQYLLDGKRLHYFPDFLLERKSKKQIIEIKPQAKVEKSDFVRFSKVMTNHLAKEGYEYLVVTDTTIRLQPRLSNIKLLWRYARLSITTKHKIMLYKLFENSAQLSFMKICLCLGQKKEQRDLVYALLFHGYLITDIERQITLDSSISLGDIN
jgi:hypothetical protein